MPYRPFHPCGIGTMAQEGQYDVGLVERPPMTASAAPWPDELLDVAALRAGGWRPTAFRDFVLKVHQRCNLACDYCYVYTMADQSWRERPVAMPAAVARAAIARIAEHAARYGVSDVHVILHGGEPLLAGAERLTQLASAVREALPPGTRAHIGVQTNGVLINEETLRLLREYDIRVGVSFDGGRTDTDRHRRYASGRSSYPALARALALLCQPEFRPVFAGLLGTVDPDTDPVACYEEMLQYEPPTVDFLLPHANWSDPPKQSGYGQWLVSVFDRWYGAPKQETHVRFFEEIISLVLGGASRTEQVGLSPTAVVVVESDGAIEQADSLKSAYSGATATGLNVLTDPFDTALAHPGVVARQIGLAALSDRCLACPVHAICGAGHYAHRYRVGHGFRNPSVYCADMSQLIDHVRERVGTDLTALTQTSRGNA